MKVLLINPPSTFRQEYNVKNYSAKIPLGLGYIASVLEEKNYSVKIYDSCATKKSRYENGCYTFGDWNEILNIVKAYNPDIVGISCIFTSRYLNSIKTAELVKKVDKNIKVIIGGVHATNSPEEFLKNKNVDMVAIGEADYFIADLLDGKPPEKRGYITDLDSIPFPARHLLPMKYYLSFNPYIRPSGKKAIRLLPRNSIVTSRSCPYDCIFCVIKTIWGEKWRARSPENIISEIESMIQKWNIKQISFEDDNICINKQRMSKLCQLMIDKNLHLKWDTPNGIGMTTLDREILTLMKKSGCFTLNLPVESGDNEMLKIMGKPHYNRLDKVEEVVSICKELNINTLGYFVIGIPGETKETIQKSIDFAVKLNLDDINVSIATPYKGTRLYKESLEKGFLNLKQLDNHKKFNADDDLVQLASVINTPWLSSDELLKMRPYFYNEFNKRVA